MYQLQRAVPETQWPELTRHQKHLHLQADHEWDSPDEDPQHTQRESPEDPGEQPDVLPPIRQSVHIPKPVDRLTYAISAELAETSPDVPGEIMFMEAIFPSVVHDPMAFAASADPDTMYLHAMKEPDKHEFIKAMVQEMNA